jgi:hypothetical protein
MAVWIAVTDVVLTKFPDCVLATRRASWARFSCVTVAIRFWIRIACVDMLVPRYDGWIGVA